MDAERYAYRAYITDSVKAMSENNRLTLRWVDLINDSKADNRTGEEIAADVIGACGLVMGGG